MAGEKRLTEEQTAWLAVNYKAMKKREVAAQLGIGMNKLHEIANAMGLTHRGKHQEPKNKVTLTEEQTAWLVKHFKNTENAKIQKRLGLSFSTLHRLARQHGLKKTPQFMRKIREERLAMMMAEQKRIKTEEPERWRRIRETAAKNLEKKEGRNNRFKKGVTNLQRIGKKRWLESIEKRRVSWLKTRDKERARANAGLNRRTNFTDSQLKVLTPEAHKRYKAKWHLSTKYGYIDGGGRTMYYEENTSRVLRHEHLYVKRYGLKFVELPDGKKEEVKYAPDWKDKQGGFA